MRILLGIIIVLAVLFVVARVAVARQPTPTSLGANNGQLQPCPDTPNCVSTQAAQSDTEHFIAPVPYTGETDFMMTQILKVVSAMPRATVIKQEGNYLHVEFRSQVFRFVDDVEFYLDDTTKLIHFRSAARLGQSDMGVNRKRMTEITEKLKTPS